MSAGLPCECGSVGDGGGGGGSGDGVESFPYFTLSSRDIYDASALLWAGSNKNVVTCQWSWRCALSSGMCRSCGGCIWAWQHQHRICCDAGSATSSTSAFWSSAPVKIKRHIQPPTQHFCMWLRAV
eukprot:1160163-Pelagomonas_calceolata.AAC.6